MPSFEHQGTTIEVDDEGYLVHFDEWNEDAACAMALREGVAPHCPLTASRIAVLGLMRQHYERFGSFPVPRAICRRANQGAACAYEQFPNPIVAWRIAGLPKPSAQVLANVRH